MTRNTLVLVVDDDDDVRATVIETLEDEGYRALGASHGWEALEKLRSGGSLPSLILLDLMMPVMDGKTFRLRQLEDPTLAQVPVVVMTADTRIRPKADELDAAGYLKKPLELSELLALCQRFTSDRIPFDGIVARAESDLPA